MNRSPRFITFEGVEGSGKSTQIRRLADWFSERALPVIYTREPGGTPLSEAIRTLLVRPPTSSVEHSMSPLTELFLMEAARAEHVDRVIRPALKANRFVLCDRFTDATVAYQGVGRKLGLPLVSRLNLIATGGLRPTLTFLFDLDTTVGLRRALTRNNDETRFEQESARFHARVRSAYRAIARQHPRRVILLDASRSEDEIFSVILQTTTRRFRIDSRS